MMVTLIVASMITFSGGHAGKLANLLADTTGRTVVILDDGSKLKAFKFWYEPKNGLNNSLKMHLDLRGVGGFAFFRPDWPEYKTRNIAIPDHSGPTDQIECDPWPSQALSEFEKDKIGRYRISDLGTSFLGSRIDIHWFYQDFIVGIGQKGTNKTELLKQIATAVGAKFSDVNGGYKLSFDSKEFRSRMAAWITKRRSVVGNRSGSGLEVADLDLLRDCLQHISDADLLASFQSKGKELKVKIVPNTPLVNTAVRRVEAYGRRSDIANANDPGVLSPSKQVSMIDWDRPVYVVFQPGTFRTSIFAMIKGTNGAINF